MCFTVSELWEFTVYASYIVFLFVDNENNDFIKEIRDVVPASIAYWKPRQSLWEFSSRWKPSIGSRVFTDLLSNSPKRSPPFSPGYEGTENMFYFLNLILFIKDKNYKKLFTILKIKRIVYYFVLFIILYFECYLWRMAK